MLTRIYFVRHAEAEGNTGRRFHGYFDSKLTENGNEQLKLLSRRFREIDVDVIYSSDLERTYQTALAISQVTGLSVTRIPQLREINGGQWEDVPWDDLPVLFSEAYELWLNYPHKLQMPGGESMKEFQERLVVAVDKIYEENRGKNICIVTHGTAIKALLCQYLGVGLEGFNGIEWCDNASITVVDICDDKYEIIAQGDNSHLGETGTIHKQRWWQDIQTRKERG